MLFWVRCRGVYRGVCRYGVRVERRCAGVHVRCKGGARVSEVLSEGRVKVWRGVGEVQVSVKV